ncbi:FtsX-like permease family protein [Chloroflexi bacterium TSY]|nr:FtsX-like permease family protein [Chloroflexi bacterium TSY]
MNHPVNRTDNIRVVTADRNVAFQSQVASLLEEHYEQKGVQVSSLDTTSDEFEQTQFQFDILLVFLSIMALLAIIVSSIGLAGTMSINVLERIPEIGILRAIGASNRTIVLIFIVEGTLIGLFSWFIGSLLAWPLSKFLSDNMGLILMEAPLSFAFPVSGLLFGLVLIIVVAAAASIFPGFNAARLSVQEVLSYE